MSKLKSWQKPRKWWRKKRTWLTIVSFPFLALVSRLYYLEINNVLAQNTSAWTEAPQADCAVALTGGPGRLKEALDLLLRGQVKKIIITGVNPRTNLRDIYPQLFLFSHLHLDDIIIERRSETTFGNAQQSLPIVEALQCRDILLVTSRVHMYRAYRVFTATYPSDLPIYKYATSGVGWTSGWIDTLVEASKSLFYSFWAY